jgi:FHS family L-fucose permease-like MFS transporter
MFWPSAVFRKYGMFVAFTFVCGSGLAMLEVGANSYIVVLGPPQYAARRLVLAQTGNGFATVIGRE